jgi:KaiC domain protein
MDTLSTGVKGLDEMFFGGIPKGSIVCVLGSCGTGKSTLCLQFIHAGLERKEKGILISFENGKNAVIETAKGYGWDFRRHIEDEMLKIVKLDASDIKASVERIESELPSLIESFGAKRLVMDSITLFEILFDDDSERRRGLFKFCELIKGIGVTTILTSEADKSNPTSSRYGLIEYVVDGFILLRHVRSEDLRRTDLSIEIIKMRNMKHSREIKPYDITSKGIEIYTGAEVF